MGVPKFFRYISERYPCLSEYVREYQIPEFDNLYLDMNGIIHMCSHPDDGIHFRISEEKIFQDIFHYIEVLFSMIKPQKLFFMAIDGVAPRAKMNQQRSRRFRSAKDAEKQETKALTRGEALPTEARFDSNCITPGTVFMAKLHEQLKYFIVDKISTNKLWQKCKIILSGHETPGEGEHKIMDYIRYMRAQPGYDPNTRHCLYGLDADLIMLGLCTHEPHFSLLREEVLFGKKSTKRKSIPEQINFYLLHLSLMREYLEQEFLPLKNGLPFEYNMEKIIDDWVLMGFLVGNDFIPHLPNLHIANNALPILYQAYMEALPTLGGYINESGHLHLDRFEKFMETLCKIDLDNFTDHHADLKYFEAKTGRKMNMKERTSYKQRDLEAWQADDEDCNLFGALEPEKPFNSDLQKLIQETDDMFLEPSESNLDELADPEEESGDSESDCGSYDEDQKLLKAEFKQHKKDYYMNKLEYAEVTPEVLRSQAECYVRAIQWNLNYYYNGVCSWGWYYPHHYAPYISDIKDFKDLKLEFDLGTPFKPYEQLLAVLPTASKALLPECYHELMVDESSPIKSYYPLDFETDMNGKKQEWEAVVLLPFIDEEKLLEAMAPCNEILTPEEIKRNTHGPMLLYEYTSKNQGSYKAPEYFPDISNHYAACTEIGIESIRVPIDKLIKGAYPGVKMDVYYPGFPTLKHLKYESQMKVAKVKVFDNPSRNENMILRVLEPNDVENIEEFAKNLLGSEILVGWPHLIEALVTEITTKNFKYRKTDAQGSYNVEELKGNSQQCLSAEKRGIVEHYKNRLGIEVGDVKILVHAKILTGRKYIFTSQGRINLEKQWAQMPSAYPVQTIVKGVATHSSHYKAYKDICEVFEEGSICFMLGQPHYGYAGTVMNSKESLQKGRVKLTMKVQEEPDFSKAMSMETNFLNLYKPGYVLANELNQAQIVDFEISNYFISRLTGMIFVVLGGTTKSDGNENRVNVGLNMKFNKKSEELPGYTKKDKIWLYTNKALDVIKQYVMKYSEFLERINDNLNDDIFFETDLVPEDNGSGKTVREIADWIKKLEFNIIERRHCDSSLLEPEIVKEIEKVIDEHLEKSKIKNVTMQVKPHLLYKPDIQMGNIPPDPIAQYNLYDRVVNVRDSYTVPLGYTGTIIAIHQTAVSPKEVVYDVLFDKSFPGGLTLNCSPNRGYRMSHVALINRTHGKRMFEEKTGKPGELLQKLSANLQKTNHSNYQNTNYPNYQPQNSAFASWININHQPMPNFNQFQNIPFPNPNVFPNTLSFPPRPVDNRMKHINYDKNKPVHMKPVREIEALQKNKPAQLAKKTDFMPNFMDGRNEPKVNTDMLKKMLKINDPPPEKLPPPTNYSVSVQDIFAHASAQHQTIPVTPNTGSYSLQLLSYYQMHSLGCPHYKYFDSPDRKSCQAQIDLPYDKQPIFGELAPTKELACENVAKLALDRLKMDQPPPINNLLINFPPPPPKQWCENKRAAQKNMSPQKYKQPTVTIEGKNANTKPNKPKVPFVPLQAVRQHRLSKSESTNENVENRKSNPEAIENENKKCNLPVKDGSKEGASPKTQTKRRERKMRIAANFSYSKTSSK